MLAPFLNLRENKKARLRAEKLEVNYKSLGGAFKGALDMLK